MYIPYDSVIIFPPKNTCLKPVTKYEKGINFTMCNNNPPLTPEIIEIFHNIGVNQNISCIITDSNCEKSGTNVHIADVNLVNATIKSKAEITKYINIKIFKTYPNIRQIATVIIKRNIDTILEEIIEITGITSTGNTTFFTK